MNLSIDLSSFRAPESPDPDFSLDPYPTRIRKLYRNKAGYQKLMDQYSREMAALQSMLYAHGRHSVLVIFQALDAAGKDGAIKHVMSGVNPQGCQVYSFKQPSSEELDHDFLWRCFCRLPERGRIGIFNRSYYEEVLIVRSEPEIFANQRLPESCHQRPHLWKERFADIRHFEDYLSRNGTTVVKFFLHLSPEEQRRRFLQRIDDPERNWKISPDDLRVRRQWDVYMEAYRDCIGQTSHPAAPWHVIPADRKRDARLLISHILVETLRGLDMHYPKVSAAQRRELQKMRKKLDHPGEAGVVE